MSSMDEELLIEYVRQYEVVYNPKCKEYKDQAIRAAIWEEIGEKMKQPPDKCKDEWTKLRNAYVNAMKRRKNKKSVQAAKAIPPWKYEELMNFLQPYLESRPTVTNLESPPNSVESDTHLEESESDTIQSQIDSRSPTPQSSSSHSSKPVRNKTNLHELYDLMKSSHDLRLQKQQNKQDMDETDLFFLSMSKAIKKLPKLEQSKIKLDLHTAISNAEIRILERQEQIRRTPINVSQQIISQPQQLSFPRQSPFAYFTEPTSTASTQPQQLSISRQSPFAYSTPASTSSTQPQRLSFPREPMETQSPEQPDSNLSAYYASIQFSEEDN